MRTITLGRADGRSDYGESVTLSEGYEHFVGEKKEFIHAKEGNFQRYLCYWPASPYGWDRCENYIFEANFPMPAIRYKITWGGYFFKWLTIVNITGPTYKVIRWWEGLHSIDRVD